MTDRWWVDSDLDQGANIKHNRTLGLTPPELVTSFAPAYVWLVLFLRLSLSFLNRWETRGALQSVAWHLIQQWCPFTIIKAPGQAGAVQPEI